MSWWVFTDPQKTGTCDRCKRPAAEHTWECGICRTVGRLKPQYLTKAVLGTGDKTSFRQHTYADHPPGAYGGVVLCYCPKSAIPAPPAPAPPPPGQPPPPAVQPRVVVRAAPAEGVLRCACTSCAGCTAGVECHRPPDGDNGRCMVCTFLSKSAPASASATAPASVVSPSAASTVPAPPDDTEEPKEQKET
jgi:hypothetical protein